MPIVRSMSLEDVPEVMNIAQKSSPFPWSEDVFQHCLQAGYPGWVLLHDEAMNSEEAEMLGFVIISLHHGECRLLNMAILPDYQKFDYGKELILHVIFFSKRNQLTLVKAEVRRSSQDAQDTLSELGFEVVGIRNRYYPTDAGREDALILARHIELEE